MTAARQILIVEDDEAIRNLLIVICRRLEFEPTAVGSAEEAIRLLDGTRGFCAVILDLMMPRTDGTAVLDHIARTGRIVPVIIATAAIHFAQSLTFDPRIVTAVVRKPFDTNELKAALLAACR